MEEPQNPEGRVGREVVLTLLELATGKGSEATELGPDPWDPAPGLTLGPEPPCVQL